LRIVLFGDEPVHGAGALGFLGIVDRAHLDAGFLLEILEDRLREDLVVTDIDDDCRTLHPGAETPEHKRRGGHDHECRHKPFSHDSFPSQMLMNRCSLIRLRRKNHRTR
jgi:hypothetical protein